MFATVDWTGFFDQIRSGLDQYGIMLAAMLAAGLFSGFVAGLFGIGGGFASYNDESFLAFANAKVTEAREMAMTGLRAAGLAHLPSATNFLYVRVPDAAAFRRRMAERKIEIRGPYGTLTESYNAHFWRLPAACAMISITVRDLPDELHRALRARAASHGRSVQAEVRAILEDAVQAAGRVKLGSLLREIGREARGFDVEIERDKSPGEPMTFE